MSLDLNLLPSQAKFQAERNRMVMLVKKLVLIVTGVWVLALVVVVGWWWYVNGQMLKVQASYLKESNGFKLELAKVAKGQELRLRLQSVKQILATRFEYGQAFQKMAELFSGEVTVKSFKLVEKGVFSVSVEAANTNVMEMVENRVIEINSGKSPIFSRVKLSGATWDKGVWQIPLEVTLKNG
jgi:hypothetical protein